MSDGHHINLSDGPAWDYSVTVTDTDGSRVRIGFVSPNDLPDLPPGPLPEQATIDAERGRKPGILVRAWWLLVGEPRVVKAADLPHDGGAAMIRGLVKLMVGEQHANLIDRLTTGTVFEIRQAYLGCQEHWCRSVFEWARDSVGGGDHGSASRATGVDARGRTVVPAEHAADHIAALFGAPGPRFATGIQGSATSDQPSGAEGVRIVGLKGDHTQNGQVSG